MRRISRALARRIAVDAQLLSLPRPVHLSEVAHQLERIQVDLTAHVAPSPELVVWSRLGTQADAAGQLDDALENGSLVELTGQLRPVEDIALFRAEMAAWRAGVPLAPWQSGPQRWVAENDGARRDVLALLRAEGPMPARAIPDTCRVRWRSTGWTNGKNVMKLLEIMERRGEVAVAHREGRERCWDLSARVWADDATQAPGLEDAIAERDRRRLVALGIERVPKRGSAPPGAVVVEVEDVRGSWWVDPGQLDRVIEDDGEVSPTREVRCALLSPLDRLVTDRTRLEDLFTYEYLLEMYKPAAARRWGYWAMPVLVGDELVGKMDAQSDHRRRRLEVRALHLDDGLTADAVAGIHEEIADLAAFLELAVVDASS